MTVVSIDNLFFINDRLTGGQSLFVIHAEKVRKVFVHEIIIRFSDNIFFLSTEESLEFWVTSQVNTINVFEPDQVWYGFDQST